MGKHPTIKYLLFILITICFASCGDEADTPVYITVNEPTFDLTPAQGVNYHDTQEFFIFHRTANLGGFPYGNEIPVLAEGMEDVIIFPGIRKNGIRAQLAIYDLMLQDTFRRDFIPGTDYVFNPVFQYRVNTVFRLNENFENSNAFVTDVDGNAATVLSTEPNIGFNNTRGGHMVVTTDNRELRVASEPALRDFPTFGSIIAEITYKNTTQLSVGVYGTNANGNKEIFRTELFLNPTDEFKKVYFDMEPAIRQSGFSDFQLLFTIIHDGISTVQDAVIDDVKIIHLQ